MNADPPIPPTPLPAALTGRSALLDGLGPVLGRRPSVVVITGEAGVGKSRLVRELLTRSPVVGHPHPGRPLPGAGRLLPVRTAPGRRLPVHTTPVRTNPVRTTHRGAEPLPTPSGRPAAGDRGTARAAARARGPPAARTASRGRSARRTAPRSAGPVRVDRIPGEGGSGRGGPPVGRRVHGRLPPCDRRRPAAGAGTRAHRAPPHPSSHRHGGRRRAPLPAAPTGPCGGGRTAPRAAVGGGDGRDGRRAARRAGGAGGVRRPSAPVDGRPPLRDRRGAAGVVRHHGVPSRDGGAAGTAPARVRAPCGGGAAASPSFGRAAGGRRGGGSR